ncbi:hypothetical protein V2W45_1434243 [Cenococcum geophilum]
MKLHQLLTIIRDLALYFSGLLLSSFVALQPRAEQIIPPAHAVNKGVIYARRASYIVLAISYKFWKRS